MQEVIDKEIDDMLAMGLKRHMHRPWF